MWLSFCKDYEGGWWDLLVDSSVFGLWDVEPSPDSADSTQTAKDETDLSTEICFVGVDKVSEKGFSDVSVPGQPGK